MHATDIPRISIGAVITGVLLDHLATPILLAPATFLWLFVRHGGGVSAELLETSGVLAAPMPIIAVVSSLSSLFGGYAAARIAGRSEVAHGALIGAAAILLAAGVAVLFPTTFPSSSHVLVMSAPVALAATIGGYLAAIVSRSVGLGT